MARPRINDPNGPCVPTTIWLPVGIRDACRENRINMSGIATMSMKQELKRIGVIE